MLARKQYEALGHALGGIEGIQQNLQALLPVGSVVSVQKVGLLHRSKLFSLLAVQEGKVRSITREVAFLLNIHVRDDGSTACGIVGDPYDMDGERIVAALGEALWGEGGGVYRHATAPIKREVLV